MFKAITSKQGRELNIRIEWAGDAIALFWLFDDAVDAAKALSRENAGCGDYIVISDDVKLVFRDGKEVGA